MGQASSTLSSASTLTAQHGGVDSNNKQESAQSNSASTRIAQLDGVALGSAQAMKQSFLELKGEWIKRLDEIEQLLASGKILDPTAHQRIVAKTLETLNLAYVQLNSLLPRHSDDHDGQIQSIETPVPSAVQEERIAEVQASAFVQKKIVGEVPASIISVDVAREKMDDEAIEIPRLNRSESLDRSLTPIQNVNEMEEFVQEDPEQDFDIVQAFGPNEVPLNQAIVVYREMGPNDVRQIVRNHIQSETQAQLASRLTKALQGRDAISQTLISRVMRGVGSARELSRMQAALQAANGQGSRQRRNIAPPRHYQNEGNGQNEGRGPQLIAQEFYVENIQREGVINHFRQ